PHKLYAGRFSFAQWQRFRRYSLCCKKGWKATPKAYFGAYLKSPLYCKLQPREVPLWRNTLAVTNGRSGNGWENGIGLIREKMKGYSAVWKNSVMLEKAIK